jgi:hypothetical protein
MNRLNWPRTAVAAAVCFLAPVVAHADVLTTYDINFSGGSPNPTSGSFTWDSTIDQFTAFAVTFESTPFNLLSAANSPGNVQGCGTQAGTNNSIPGSALDSFDMMTNPGGACGSGTTSGWLVDNGFLFFAHSTSGPCSGVCSMGIDDSASGPPITSGTFSASVAPEPDTLTSTIGGGALLMLAAWKRRRRRSPTAHRETARQ